jgi:hypothetical protein
MALSPTIYVQIRGTSVRANVRTREEAKLALKELKLKKKEFGLMKRTITERQKSIRVDYTDEVRTRGSMLRGGGGIGKVFRLFQTVARDGRRAQLARALAPLESEKENIETMVRAIDGVIIQLEAYILGP